MTPHVDFNVPPITLADRRRMARPDCRPLFVRIASGLLIAALIIILATASSFGGRS